MYNTVVQVIFRLRVRERYFFGLFAPRHGNMQVSVRFLARQRVIVIDMHITEHAHTTQNRHAHVSVFVLVVAMRTPIYASSCTLQVVPARGRLKRRIAGA